MKWLTLIFFWGGLTAQVSYDTIIDMGTYKSYFNRKIKQPVVVVYRLYHGGGEASRNNDHFRGTEITLHDKDYTGSGYDRGHLVPAEDFAYSDSLQALTFSYYNCVPQFPKLNRGKWKNCEGQVRKLSQKDTVIVVCYNEYEKDRKGLVIPEACYKFVYNTEGKLLMKVGYANDAGCKEKELDVEILKMLEALID